MTSFERMFGALIICLDRDEVSASTPPEGPPRASIGTGSIHGELKKVKFPEFLGALDNTATEAWFENMAM
jgi:hypothetical protein